MKNYMNNNSTKGMVSWIVIAVVALLIAGGAYVLMKKNPEQKIAETDAAILDAAVSVPSMNFSASPLPDLNSSSLNVAVPEFPTATVFSAPTVNSDFSYAPGDLNIAVPTPSLDFQMPQIPTGIPAGVSVPGSAKSSSGNTSATPPAGAGAPQIDCGIFAAPPSCSFVGAPGSQGYEACKKCYPNK